MTQVNAERTSEELSPTGRNRSVQCCPSCYHYQGARQSCQGQDSPRRRGPPIRNRFPPWKELRRLSWADHTLKHCTHRAIQSSHPWHCTFVPSKGSGLRRTLWFGLEKRLSEFTKQSSPGLFHSSEFTNWVSNGYVAVSELKRWVSIPPLVEYPRLDFVFSMSRLNKSSKVCLCVNSWRVSAVSFRAPINQ